MTDVSEMKGLFDISGKVAVVVGAGSGIGRGIAYAFGAGGGKVVASDVSEKSLAETVGELRRGGCECIGTAADCTEPEQTRALRDGALARYGRIDALYVTPGINVRKRISDYAYDEFDRVVNLNLKGTFTVMKEFGGSMAEGGSIVVVSSIRATTVEAGQSVYAATKAAVVQLARTQAAELAKHNVRVNAIAPGYVDTPLVQQIKLDDGWYSASRGKSVFDRWAKVKEVAGPAVFLATPAASYITGAVIYIDGGWTAVDGRYEPNV